MNNSSSFGRSFGPLGATSSLITLCSVLALAGCAEDGGDDDGGDPAVEGSLSVTVPTAAVRLARTNRVEVPIEIARDQLEGDVTVELVGLPSDVTAEPLTIGAGETAGMLIVSAGAAASQLTPATVTVTATSGDAAADASLGIVVTGVPGTPDESYGTGGLRLSGVAESDYGVAAALAPDGKVVLAWYENAATALHVRRYDASGQLDTTFSGDGDVVIDSGAGLSIDSGQNVAVRSDGTIVVAYRKGLNALVVGLTSTGGPAPGFGEAASTLTLTNVDFGGAPNWFTLTRDPAGSDYAVAAIGDTAQIYKLTSGGIPDPSFGNAGVVTTSALGGYAAAIDAQARIVVAGMLYENRTVGRIAANGTLDTTFSGDGRNTMSEAGGADFMLEVTVLSDNRIAAVGYTGNPIVHVFGDGGELDSSFSGDGQLTIAGTYARIVQHGDALVMATGGSGGGFNVYRISLTDGSLVSSFDGDGIAVLPLGATGYSTVQQALIDAEGRLVLVGNRQTPSGYDFAIARIWL